MTLSLLIFIGGISALIVLIAYTVKEKAYAVLGLSLGLIGAIVFLSVAGYRVQMGYDHMHMTGILGKTAEAIRAGEADAIVAAYDRFSSARTNADVTFWAARNQLYEDLKRIPITTNVIQQVAPATRR